jgi:hypothetical protein
MTNDSSVLYVQSPLHYNRATVGGAPIHTGQTSRLGFMFPVREVFDQLNPP